MPSVAYSVYLSDCQKRYTELAVIFWITPICTILSLDIGHLGN